MEKLLPDRLKELWESVEQGRLSADEFVQAQDNLIQEHRQEWEQALLLKDQQNLQESVLEEIAAYFGNPNLEEIRLLCSRALKNIKAEWCNRVEAISNENVEHFYDRSEAMLFELMWWHTLVEDLSPLAYVVALNFARRHGCARYLDFGSGVGSGGILFAHHRFATTLADISSTALALSKWRLDRRGFAAEHLDLKTQQLPEAAFDIITAMDVFEHLVDPVTTVHDLWRALQPGGFLFGRFSAEVDEDRPHHIVIDFQPTLEAMQRLGLVGVWQDQWLWGHMVFQKL
mgnify:CR=1 FL=1